MKRRAMGEADDAEGAEHQGQPERDQRISAALVEAAEKLREYGVHLVSEKMATPTSFVGGKNCARKD